MVRARYDAAQTTDENRNHWLQADSLSAAAAGNPFVRRTIRNRARYEVANNSYARGIVLTLANYVIGTGPRLQMLTDFPDANAMIETEFARWSDAIGLPQKLRTMRMAKAQDGEAFALLINNERVDSPVRLDLRLIEADQISTPNLMLDKPNAIDGIVFDEFGNPAEYHILKSHPGSNMPGSAGDYTPVPASSMLHWFRCDRPEQWRGLPDILPALPLFAQLRRYTLAVLGAAEIAANTGVIFHTPLPPDTQLPTGTGEDGKWGGEEMDFPRNVAMFAPEGFTPFQMKAEQPSTTHDMFVKAVLNEIARCLNMPYNIAAGNSARYNYASGRLDHQMYFKSIRVEQTHCEGVVLDPILNAWMVEAVKVLDDLQDLEEWPHQWFWTGHEHVDPNKEATAATALLGAGLLTEAEYCARKGMDWEEEQDQRKREAEGRKKRGLPEPTGAAPAKDPDEDLDEKIDEKLDEKRETADAPA
ncbi:MAG TPA: phage portal protein [Phycisphaerae bacterium]|nr:phage portal protein [Phycisphaerae bacterium]